LPVPSKADAQAAVPPPSNIFRFGYSPRLRRQGGFSASVNLGETF
jgi:hypothetical protein